MHQFFLRKLGPMFSVKFHGNLIACTFSLFSVKCSGMLNPTQSITQSAKIYGKLMQTFAVYRETE